MRLVKVTDTLYVSPERVIAVEERTVTTPNGESRTFVELTMETMIRWMLDMPLAEVVLAVDRTHPYSEWPKTKQLQ
jgi:hypothetical protein